MSLIQLGCLSHRLLRHFALLSIVSGAYSARDFAKGGLGVLAVTFAGNTMLEPNNVAGTYLRGHDPRPGRLLENKSRGTALKGFET
jgi:hypothetical protein